MNVIKMVENMWTSSKCGVGNVANNCKMWIALRWSNAVHLAHIFSNKIFKTVEKHT